MERSVSVPESGNLEFFLGGRDLEMLVIRDLISEVAPDRLHDKNLSWGARASSYKTEIETCLREGRTPVLIELENDLGLDPAQTIIIIDHHGARAGHDKPTSLHQVFDLLQLPPQRWTRWMELVAANDRGYIPAMKEAGASRDEIEQVRRRDRRAQGITEQEESLAEQSLKTAEALASGRLTLVRLAHSRTAAVTDRLDPCLGGAGYDNLLVVSPSEINFFGAGDLIASLDCAFPGGWSGGALPERGFWGHAGADSEDMISFLASKLAT